MKYILMMNATKADFDRCAKWSQKDLRAQFAFMHAFNKELKDSGMLIAAEGLAFADASVDSTQNIVSGSPVAALPRRQPTTVSRQTMVQPMH